MEFQNVAVGRINGMAALTGFSVLEENVWALVGTKKGGRIDEVTVSW